MHLGNLTLTKMQPTSAEKPRVRIGVVSVSMGLKREQYFIGHTWSPYFSEDTGKTICIQVLPNSPIKKYGSKNKGLAADKPGELETQVRIEPSLCLRINRVTMCNQ